MAEKWQQAVLLLTLLCGILGDNANVTVTQVSGEVLPGGKAQFTAALHLKSDDNITMATWTVNEVTLCTYNMSEFVIDPGHKDVVRSCRMDTVAQESYLEIVPTNCYSGPNINISFNAEFKDNKTANATTPFLIGEVLNAAVSKPIPYLVAKNTTWNFTFSCDVTGSTQVVTNITLVTSEKYQNGSHFENKYDNKTCLNEGTYTTDVMLPFGACATYQCDATYDKTVVKGENMTYCNNITYPKPVAEPMTSPLRSTSDWTFKFACLAIYTQVQGNLSLDSSKVKGNHTTNIEIKSTQDNTTKVWTNTLTADVTVPVGKDGSGRCDTYSCDAQYMDHKEKVLGDPQQYCNNGTGVTITGNPAVVEIGGTVELVATFDTDMIEADDDPATVTWYYKNETIYTYNSATGDNKTSGEHGGQIKAHHTDPFFKNSTISYQVSACDIDTADISCELTTPKKTAGKSMKKVMINDVTKAPTQDTPPLHKVVANNPWKFTFKCYVTGVTQDLNITLNATSANHTGDQSSSTYDNKTCLHSATFTSTVTVAFNACSTYECIATYPSLNKTMSGGAQEYCNSFTYPKAKAKPIDPPSVLRLTPDWSFVFECSTEVTSLNGSITLVPVSAKGNFSDAEQENVYDDKTKMWINKLKANVTVPAGNGSSHQCDTYRCDITYKNGNHTQHVNGDPQDYCNNGTGVTIAQSPDSVNISAVLDLNASLAKIPTGDEAVVITWYYNNDAIYIYNKTSKENKTSGDHRKNIIKYDTDTDFKYSYIDMNVSACDIGATISAKLQTSKGHAGLYTLAPEITPVLNSPMLMTKQNHTSSKETSMNLTFLCDVTGSTDNFTLTFSGEASNVTKNVTKDEATCLWSGVLHADVMVKYGDCADYSCTAQYQSGNVTSQKVSFCNGGSSEKKLKGWQIALIAVGTVLVVSAICAAVGTIYRKKRRANQTGENEQLINEAT